MTEMVPWLPAEALNPAHFERAISSLVDDWGSHWFAQAKPNCRIRLREINTIDSARLARRSWGNECSVSLDEAGRLALAEAMLDRAIAANAVMPADRPLLNDVTNRCLDDLLGRLSWLIDGDRSPTISDDNVPSEPGICWEIGLKRSGVTVNLAVHCSALVRWRKALAPADETPKLTSLLVALRNQSVRIDLDAGHGSLSLAELENLAQGDVVVLDRRIDGPLELLASGRPTGIAGKLSTDKQTLRVDIIEKKKVSK